MSLCGPSLKLVTPPKFNPSHWLTLPDNLSVSFCSPKNIFSKDNRIKLNMTTNEDIKKSHTDIPLMPRTAS